jgi:hypothetical protein
LERSRLNEMSIAYGTIGLLRSTLC